MTDKPKLSDHTIKNLLDKAPEKRELGGKDLKDIVSGIKNEDQMRMICVLCKDTFMMQQSFQHKRAGLHALYSIAQAIAKQEKFIRHCLDDIICPMLDCFKDKEERVRYTGIEYMFFTCKCLNDIVLLKFDDIFRRLITTIVDGNDQVKRAATSLDNCLKSIVTSTQPEKQYFKIETFIPIISEKITAKNHLAKQNLITWISTLNAIPYIELFDYISQFLKELFLMLADNGITHDAKSSARKQLEEFQRDIERYTQRNQFNTQQELTTHRKIIEILIQICQETKDPDVLFQVLSWIQEYLRIVNMELENLDAAQLEMSGPGSIRNLLNQNVFEQKREPILQQVIMENLNRLLQQILCLLSHDNQVISQQAQGINALLLIIMEKLKETSKEFIDIMPTIQQMLKEKNSHTAENALVWMKHLLNTYSDKLLPMIDNILENLIERLRDAEPTVISNVMEVLASISHEQYFDLVIEKILNVFYRYKQGEQIKKTEIIIRKLCAIKQPELVYTTICSKLLQKYIYNEETEIQFVSLCIQCLEYLLLTDKQLQKTRQSLRNYKYEKDPKIAKATNEFFAIIYKTFCLNPVSVISISFLAEEYELAYYIVQFLSEQEQELDQLVQVAKLINQIESPVFAYLRLQMLEASQHPFLCKSLQGLLMLLPQTPIQNLLKQRLKNVDLFFDSNIGIKNEIINKQDYQQLYKTFNNIQAEEQKMKSEREMKLKQDKILHI